MEKNISTNVAPTAAKANTNPRTRFAHASNSNTNTHATNHRQPNPSVVPPPRSTNAADSVRASNSSSQHPPKRGRPRKDNGPTKPWVIALPAPRATAGLPPLYPPPMDSQTPGAPLVSQAPPVKPVAPIPPAPLFNAPRPQAARKDAPTPPLVSSWATSAPIGLSSLPREINATKITATPREAPVAPMPPAPVLSDLVVPMVPTPAPDIETLTPRMSSFLEPPAPMFPHPPAPESPLVEPEGPSAAPAEDWVRKRGRSKAECKNIGTVPKLLDLFK